MLSMACGDMFHNDSYEFIGSARPGRGGGAPQAVARAHAYTPSLVAAQISCRYE